MRTSLTIILTLLVIALWALIFRASFERFLSPGLGTCMRCHRPWIVPARGWEGNNTYRQLSHDRFNGLIGVHYHTTGYGDPLKQIKFTDAGLESTEEPERDSKGEIMYGEGCFPLCEGCWQELKTPEARLPYYEALLKDWSKSDRDELERKETALKRELIIEAVRSGR